MIVRYWNAPTVLQYNFSLFNFCPLEVDSYSPILAGVGQLLACSMLVPFTSQGHIWTKLDKVL